MVVSPPAALDAPQLIVALVAVMLLADGVPGVEGVGLTVLKDPVAVLLLPKLSAA